MHHETFPSRAEKAPWTKYGRYVSRSASFANRTFYGGSVIAKKKPIISIKYSYIGKASDFETFLKTIVRDYLAADDPAENPEAVFVDKVESKEG